MEQTKTTKVVKPQGPETVQEGKITTNSTAHGEKCQCWWCELYSTRPARKMRGSFGKVR